MTIISASKFIKTINALGLAFGLMTSASAGLIGTGAGGSVPDGTSAAVSAANAGLFTSDIVVSDTSIISAFNSVTITNLNHTWSGDLGIQLTHNGVTVDLVDRLGANTSTSVGTGRDYNGTYTFMLGGAPFVLTGPGTTIAGGTYAPYPNAAGGLSPATQTLANFNGQSASGTWTLTIRDFAREDVGTFTAWSIDATLEQANVPVPGSALLLGIGLLGLAARRRRN